MNSEYTHHYYTFGNYEIDSIKKNLKKLPRLKAVGSLRAAVAKEYLEKRQNVAKKKYDICLVSEAFYTTKLLFGFSSVGISTLLKRFKWYDEAQTTHIDLS